jgi:Prokaryotic phospholipase A2
MKLSTIAAALLPAAAMASPVGTTTDDGLAKRQTSLITLTDQLVFTFSLSAFLTRRNARNPPTLDWTSDSCSSSPNNPLGFPFDRKSPAGPPDEYALT